MEDTKNFIEAFVEADLAPGGRFAGQKSNLILLSSSKYSSTLATKQFLS